MPFIKLAILLSVISISLLGQKIEPTYKQVSYGPHKDMTLNFWKVESKKPTPLLVHIHGGGWLGGKKNETANANELKKRIQLRLDRLSTGRSGALTRCRSRCCPGHSISAGLKQKNGILIRIALP